MPSAEILEKDEGPVVVIKVAINKQDIDPANLLRGRHGDRQGALRPARWATSGSTTCWRSSRRRFFSAFFKVRNIEHALRLLLLVLSPSPPWAGWPLPQVRAAARGRPTCRIAFVALAEQADMPPQEAGVIQEIAVNEGEQVAEKQLLLQLDDRKAQREQDVAEAKYEAAKAKAERTTSTSAMPSPPRTWPRPSTKSTRKPTTTFPVRSPRCGSTNCNSSARRPNWPSRRPSSTGTSPPTRPRSPRPKSKPPR